LRFILASDFARSASGNRIVVPAGTTEIELLVPIEPVFAKQLFNAVVQTAARETVWSCQRLPGQTADGNPVVAVKVTTSELRGSDFLIFLSIPSDKTPGESGAPVSTHAFRLVRE
jgi:hypothetical protein